MQSITSVITLLLVTITPVFAQDADPEWVKLNKETLELKSRGEYDLALIPAKKAIEEAGKNLGPKHPDVATLILILADIYRLQGNYVEADPLFEEAQQIMRVDLTPAAKDSGDAAQWGKWIEPDFPYFSSAVDSRSEAAENNLTPRALIFPLGQDFFLAYDVDLLRVAVVWKAGDSPFIEAGMAVYSYPYRLRKVGKGQLKLPKPNGEILFQNGIYPGVGYGSQQFTDPRLLQPSEEEVGRGGLDPKLARFLGIDLSRGVEIEYEVGGAVRIRERFSMKKTGLVRHLEIGPHAEPVFIVLANDSADEMAFQCRGRGIIETLEGHVVCRIEPAKNEQSIDIIFQRPTSNLTALEPALKTSSKRWKEAVSLSLPTIQSSNALNLEEIPLPFDNPYGRGVRAAALDFFTDGRAAIVTFDGDVWIAEGLRPGSTEVVWTRFTSGLHEPLNIRIRNDEIFIFDRNGLWRLLDRDNNGEADYHELFCSQIDQTAETREFASSLVLDRDGSFLICKPGQRTGIGSRSSSAILRISADGKVVTREAYGFRQPFIGLDPLTGQIAASDQQGEFVPSSPVYFIKKGAFYGYENSPADSGKPVTEPLTWIPHQVCAAALSIVWTRNSKMGPLADVPILLAYHPPRIFQIHTDIDDIVTQGGVTPLDVTFPFALLNSAVNPADGLLYLTGFKIWDSVAREVTGLHRLRHNPDKTWTIPTVARVEKRGILLKFAAPLDPEIALKPESYGIRRWNYKRTKDYGSPNYKLDGSLGTETLPVASVKLSGDNQTVFLGVPDMREVMQIEVTYAISAKDGTPIKNQTFLTAHLLRTLALTEHGFADDQVDLSMKDRPVVAKKIVKPTVELGQRLYTQIGCMACHSIDGSTEGKSGPTWLGLFGSSLKLTTGEVVAVDEDYLRESILNPTAKIVEGVESDDGGMPPYKGVLSEEQIDSIILYIKTLSH